MLEYKRMHSRSSARVAELERRKQALEAGLEGVEVCWSEVGILSFYYSRRILHVLDHPSVWLNLDPLPSFVRSYLRPSEG